MVRDDKQSTMYVGVEHWSSYQRDEGLLMLPIAGEPDEGDPLVDVVRVHSPIGMRVVSWDEKKRGNPPLCPDPNYTGGTGNDVLFNTGINVRMPGPQAEAAWFNWHVCGEYAYVQLQARTRDDGYPTGNYPFTLPTQDPETLQLMTQAGDTQDQQGPADTQPAIDAYFSQDIYYWLRSNLPFWFFDSTLIVG